MRRYRVLQNAEGVLKTLILLGEISHQEGEAGVSIGNRHIQGRIKSESSRTENVRVPENRVFRADGVIANAGSGGKRGVTLRASFVTAGLSAFCAVM